MRVEEYIRKNVVFVGIEAAGRFVPLGTGCLGGVDVGEFTFTFLITAAHVVDTIAGDMISVRLNRKVGDCATFMIPKSYRLSHTDPANDLALFPVIASPDIFDFTMIPLMASELSEARDKFPPGVGDEVAVVGPGCVKTRTTDGSLINFTRFSALFRHYRVGEAKKFAPDGPISDNSRVFTQPGSVHVALRRSQKHPYSEDRSYRDVARRAGHDECWLRLRIPH
jgi:hypothetical protein